MNPLLDTDETYVQYELPKQGVFRVETGEYGPDGWVRIEEQSTIIGETSEHYVTRLSNGSVGMWEGDIVVQHDYVCHIGYHKSRFVKWVDSQLKLF